MMVEVLDEEDDASFQRWEEKQKEEARKRADYVPISGPKETYWGPRETKQEDRKAFDKWWKKAIHDQDFYDLKTIEKPKSSYIIPFTVEWTWRVIKLAWTNSEAHAILNNWVYKDCYHKVETELFDALNATKKKDAILHLLEL
ncbi:hypothetical protein IW262DRAFT_1300441 [Armillaria fumosa]|nr:hypothetical protein IW262DRAFT_1300441 [Armillaria fumosa]